MSSESEARPEWIDEALVVRCAACGWREFPGSRRTDGSGICQACAGATWIVLAVRDEARIAEFTVSRPALSSDDVVECRDPVSWIATRATDGDSEPDEDKES